MKIAGQQKGCRMKTACQIISVIAMIAVALPSGQAAEPPAGDKGPSLRFELADGTVISGPPDVKAIGIRIASNDILKIPVAELAELNVGLNDLGGLVKRTKALVKALSKKTGKQIVLPTEAQWEYASRAGANTSFSFGDDYKALEAHGWFNANSGGKHHPVARKKPNAFGLHDMHGNVWEWCRDGFDDGFYAKAKNVDPENTATSRYRAQRGGSWRNDAASCRSAMRGRSAGGDRNYDFGFRVVIESGSSTD